ncbi:MAG: SDR family NAD(P)-dependent oxidoreductase [Anaerolineae bacterium]|nr:SDR family NAD(P)-dependent oxidoreductase [Anaerolineae bacterium]
MDAKIALITGANSGLGKAAALKLAKLGWNVVMLCRDAQRGEQARQEIITASGNENIRLITADLGSKVSIKNFVGEFERRYSQLNLLINCAGIRVLNYQKTGDGIELMFGSEYLGHFILTNWLVPRLKAGAPSKVITISGEGHKAGVEGGVGASINFDDITYEKKWDVLRASKQVVLAKILFTYELARRLEGSGVSAVTVSPRFSRTNLSNHYPWFVRWIAAFRMWQARAVSPELGADDVLYPALAPQAQYQTGKYYVEGQEGKSSPESYDPEIAKRLWEISETFAGEKFL